MILPSTVADLKFCMENCEQFPGVSVFQHGEAVYSAYEQLINHLFHGAPLPEGWRIPEWAYDLSDIPNELMQDDLSQIIRTYLIWHDCGKPFCLTLEKTVLEDGTVLTRRHFPNHAQISHDVWLKINGDDERNKRIAELMRHDMDFHTLKSEGIPAFKALKDYRILMLAGLAEIHANAEMFGGLDSDNFKIKAKHMAKRGKQILGEKSK